MYKIVEILSTKDGSPRRDGRYPLRIGRTCNIDGNKLWCMQPARLDYVTDADGNDYSNKTLFTSPVIHFEKKDGNLEITTLNSVYILEPIGENSELELDTLLAL